MKRAAIILAALACVASAPPPGATLPEPSAAALADYATAACPEGRTWCFTVHVHVAATDAGRVVPPAWLAEQIALANALFAPAGAAFTVASADAVSPLHVVTHADRRALAPQVTGSVIHVFVTGALDNVDAPAEQIRGVTLRTGATKYIILSAYAPSRVLAHELGHLFGLPHSRYAESIMNKTPREQPPMAERRFHEREVQTILRTARELVRTKVLTARG